MNVRSSIPSRPSNQGSVPPPALTPEILGALGALPRRTACARRVRAAGEVWLQAEGTADGWIRCRAVEVGAGSMLLLAGQSPTIAQGTWARLASSTTPAGGRAGRASGQEAGVVADGTAGGVAGGSEGDFEQVRVFPLALYRIGEAVVIECETPVDPLLMARLAAR